MKHKNRSLKKWLCLILALVLALSSGCGASEEKPAEKTQQEDVEKSEKEKEDTEKPEPEDETDNRERTDAQEPDPVNIRDRKLDVRFEQDQLVLRETRNGGLHLSPRDLVLTEEFKAYYTETYDEELDFDRYLEDAIDSAEEDGDMPQILSFSPTGRSGLAAFGDTLATFYDGKCYLPYPSAARGVEDAHNSMDLFINQIQTPKVFNRLSEVVYSPDGRYAVIQTPYFFAFTVDKITAPILIDLASGEMVLMHDCYPFKQGIGQTFITGDFSADGQFFYYMIFGTVEDEDHKAQYLYRYDLSGNSSELCIGFDEKYMSYSDLIELDDGSWLAMCEERKNDQEARTTGYLQFSLVGDEWTSTWIENTLKYNVYHPIKVLYSSNSGSAVVIEPSAFAKDYYNGAFQVLKPNRSCEGKDTFYCIDRKTEKIVSFSPEEYQKLRENGTYEEYLGILLSPELSPDGNYLLMYAAAVNEEDLEKKHRLFLIRLEDMELRVIKGIDKEALRDSLIGINKLSPFFEWKNDQIIMPWFSDHSTFTFE